MFLPTSPEIWKIEVRKMVLSSSVYAVEEAKIPEIFGQMMNKEILQRFFEKFFLRYPKISSIFV